MKRLGIILAATVGLAGLAQAADLPTKKEAAPAPPPNCYASFWTWLNSSASDCPISAYGITLYGTLDVNYGYQEWGAPRARPRTSSNTASEATPTSTSGRPGTTGSAPASSA